MKSQMAPRVPRIHAYDWGLLISFRGPNGNAYKMVENQLYVDLRRPNYLYINKLTVDFYWINLNRIK